MLSDYLAPGRLRDGDPQALAALVAVGGWSVVSYCERAGAGDGAASAVVLAFVTFRRRAIEAGDDAAAELELILLESARDAVDELASEAPAGEDARAAEEAFARASPRPLSARLATNVLRALAEAAPVGGELLDVRAAAERSYGEAYGAAQAAPAVTGEELLGPASPLLRRAAAAGAAISEAGAAAISEAGAAAISEADVAAIAPGPAEQPAAAPRSAAPRARPSALASVARGRPARLAAAGAAALLLAVLVVITGDEQAPRSRPAAVTRTATVTVPAAQPRQAAAAAQVVRGTPREPLTANGARYEVVAISDVAWARKIRARPPRTTYRWVTVAVRTRNLSRRDLALRGLGYRLRTQSGAIVGPLAIELTGARGGRVARGSRASVQLGFEVGPDAGSLTFAFEPGGLQNPTVLVPLGSGA